MAVGSAKSLALDDPPCLRGIDTRIRYGKLHFMLYFSFVGFVGWIPFQSCRDSMLKEYMAKEVGVEDGEIIAASKGLHLYDYCWDLAKARIGRKK